MGCALKGERREGKEEEKREKREGRKEKRGEEEDRRRKGRRERARETSALHTLCLQLPVRICFGKSKILQS